MPRMMSDEEEESKTVFGLVSIVTRVWCSRKSQERVVWSFRMGSGKTDTTPGLLAIEVASSFDRRAANPENPCLYFRIRAFSFLHQST